MSDDDFESWRALTRRSASDSRQVAIRFQLARTTAETFSSVGTELHLAGHILGGDRVSGRSPFGHGSDEVVAVSLLLRIAGQLVSASADLFEDGRHYAAAALLRQIVEVEYLAWAFAARDSDAERWLRSTKEERREFFAPAKLRDAAQGRFRGKDYGYHCELGGHPVPQSALLMDGDDTASQLLLSDMLGHTGHIWNHLLAWSADQPWANSIHKQNERMCSAYAVWKGADELVDLPPPP